MTCLQPYRAFEACLLPQLSKQDKFYLVSQSYSRAEHAGDHTKRPILFSPYKELYEAQRHFKMLKDKCAAIVDIRNPNITARMQAICSGKTDIMPFIALVENMEAINRYIDQHYHQQMRSWVRINKQWWNIREPNSLQPSFHILMGEPVIKIKWGSHDVMVKLEELESM